MAITYSTQEDAAPGSHVPIGPTSAQKADAAVSEAFESFKNIGRDFGVMGFFFLLATTPWSRIVDLPFVFEAVMGFIFFCSIAISYYPLIKSDPSKFTCTIDRTTWRRNWGRGVLRLAMFCALLAVSALLFFHELLNVTREDAYRLLPFTFIAIQALSILMDVLRGMWLLSYARRQLASADSVV
jgi:hypothetical protein